MIYTGKVFEFKPILVATIEIIEKQKYLDVSVEVNNKEIMAFPLPLDSDVNAIKSRIHNIVNQTGLANSSVFLIEIAKEETE